MSSELRVASLNLRAYPNPQRGQINRLARIIRAQECDVVLLQECLRPWLDVVCEVTGFTGVHSHRLSPATPPDAFSPDGCAIAVRPSIELGSCRRIPPESFMPSAVQEAIFEEPPAGFEPMPERLAYRSSGRSILAEIVADDETVVVGSFHATPGSGSVGGMQVGEWKPFFHGAVAVELAALERPFVFAIDANEPFSETVDSIVFHWEEGRSGVAKIQALLGREPIHRGRDLFREWLATTGGEPVSPDLLQATYAPSPTFQRRFDSIWATPEFSLTQFATHFDEVVAAGGDHAMLVADLRVGRASRCTPSTPVNKRTLRSRPRLARADDRARHD